MLERERCKLEASIGGIRNMKGLPEAIFIIDANQERNAIREANCLGIPVVALVDTNTDPDGVDYIIPGNDDAHSSVRYFIKMVANELMSVQSKNQELDRVQEQKKIDKKAAVVIKKKTVAPEKEKVIHKEREAQGASKKTADKKPAAKKTVAEETDE
jgi:ribosomal protein S2